jgi:formylglycine-generating enzyme required for sulfatase activity
LPLSNERVQYTTYVSTLVREKMGKISRVFISHTSEFTKYPEKRSFVRAAIDAVNRTDCKPCDMEYFTARHEHPAEYCKKCVQKCDVYVGVIGLRYGSPVRDRPEVSYTELEFEAATEVPTIKRFIFLLDYEAPAPVGRFMDVKYGDRQEQFRKRLSDAGVMCKSFSNADELEMLIYQALKEYEKEMGESSLWPIDHASSAVLEHMVRVPKGPFVYGGGRGHQELNRDYWIDIYPVTNEQYGKFILANGYEEKDHWSPEGWKAKGNIIVPSYWDDENFNKPDHPVVGVSYYEAEAYAKWRKKRLPTEQEWEKAARGDDGRHYPWGNNFDTNKCNGFKSQIGNTTPVTQYPNGISPYGCYDMVGNVSEWCASHYDGERQDYCVLRSGGWDATQNYLKISNRGTSYPLYRYFNLGFRLVQDNEP